MNYECLACGTKFTEMEQTRSEYRNGQCPSCGYEDIKPVDLDIEKELADLKAMREASAIRPVEVSGFFYTAQHQMM